MNKILHVPINKLRPDKDQPRRIINEIDLEGLAGSIKNEGIINPIEIDDDMVIITGERRWRAAKLAGLKTVLCFTNNIEGKDRFKHQVHENIHHNTMNDIDTAKALYKILIDYGKLSPGARLQGRDQGISWLSAELGKSTSYINDKLSLLRRSLEFQRAVEEKKIKGTMGRVLRATPEDYKERMERRILNNDFATRDGGFEVAKALNRNPEKADEILSTSFKELSTDEVKDKLREIGSTEITNKEIKSMAMRGDNITKYAHLLNRALNETPLNEVSSVQRSIVLRSLIKVKRDIEEFIRGEKLQIIEGEMTR